MTVKMVGDIECDENNDTSAVAVNNADTEEENRKLSHKKWRRLWKKEKRRKDRQQKRKELDKLEEEEKIRKGLLSREAIEAYEKQEEWQEALQEKRRQKLHEEWLAKEKEANLEFENKRKEEERRKQERLDQERRIKEEWESQQKREERGKLMKEKAAKQREENLNQALEKSGILKASSQDEEPWHNPIAPNNNDTAELFGTERDPNNCSFYLKTGACRFGERCSRQHPRPSTSQTLLIPNMFQDVRLTEVMLDEKDQDVGLEFDEDELYSNFKEFYKDVLEEFKNIGRVQQFKVCCNFEPHLRGNVYVQFRSEDDALNAFAKFNGRWYAGRQLSVQFCPVTKWKSAICGTFARNRCPRGKNCNFLHVFRNPNNEFRDADRDVYPSPSYSNRFSEREWRSSTRELERRWERAESYSSQRDRSMRLSRRTDYSRRRRRSRSRDKCRSRSRDRSRSRSREQSTSTAKHEYKSSYGNSSRRKGGSSHEKSRRNRQSKSRSPSRRRSPYAKRTYERSESSSDSDSDSHHRDHRSKRRNSSKKLNRKTNNSYISKKNSDDEFVPEFDSD